MMQNIHDLKSLKKLEDFLWETFKLYRIHIDIIEILADEYFSRCKLRNDIYLSINIADKLSNAAWEKCVLLDNKLTKMKNNYRRRYSRKIIKVQVQLDEAVAHEKKVNKIVENLKTEYNTACKNTDSLNCYLDYLTDRVKIILNVRDSLNSDIVHIRMNIRNY